MDWKNKTVLVTEAGSFIGSHLTLLLAPSSAQDSCLKRRRVPLSGIFETAARAWDNHG